MFDKLDDLLIRFEEVLNELGEPGVTDNQEHFQKLKIGRASCRERV